jgi:hypothetical protein
MCDLSIFILLKKKKKRAPSMIVHACGILALRRLRQEDNEFEASLIAWPDQSQGKNK